MKKYNYIDLFHGIGGFALGAYWAGMKFKNHFCSDIEPYCQELYKLRFPDSIQLGDITKIDTEELKKYGDKWIITGGFPCQDISIAGKGAGITGERSGLWFEYWRLIRDLRPCFAIMENVSALTFRGLDAVLGSLSEIGYNAEWQDIRASDVGAPHKREREWIVAYSNTSLYTGKLDTRGNKKSSATSQNRNGSERKTSYGKRIWIKFGTSSQDVADTTGEGATGHSIRKEKTLTLSGNNSKMANTNNSSGTCGRQDSGMGLLETNERKANSRTWERVNQWAVEPSICGMANGISNELYGYEGRLANKSYQRIDRLKGLGNAIVPQIAEILFRQIKSYIEEIC